VTPALEGGSGHVARRGASLANLWSAGRLLASAPAGADLPDMIARAAARLRAGGLSTVRILVPGEAGLGVAACAGPAVPRAAAALDADLASVVLAAGRAVLVRDARIDARVRCAPLWRERGYAAWHGVPLPGPEGPAGVLGLALPADQRPLARDERAALEAYATQAGLALRAARLATTVERQAQALAVARAELLETSRLLAFGHVVSDVVHETSNVLGTVMLRLESLLEEPHEPRTAAVLAALDGHCRQIADLLHELRRYWSGGGVRAVVNLDELIERLLRLREPRMRARGTRFERARAGHLPAVLVDPAHVERAVLTLLIEAEAAVRGRGVVRLGTEARRDESGAWVVVTVSDDGPPIADALLAQLFDPFAPRGQGRGPSVGLAAAHAIVAGLGGRLTVANDAGGGVTFRLELPAVS